VDHLKVILKYQRLDENSSLFRKIVNDWGKSFMVLVCVAKKTNKTLGPKICQILDEIRPNIWTDFFEIISTNGKEAMVNRALDGSTYPS
jgi:hypothetical protein